MRRSLLAVTSAFVLLTPAAAQAAEGDIIVQREPGLDRSERRELREDAGVELVAALPLERTELVAPADGDVTEALAELREDEDVVYAEPDTRVTASVQNDFYWTSLWGLSNNNDADIDAPEAWERSVGAGITVAIVDTGINATHEDLLGQIAANPGEQPGNGVDDDHDGLVDDAAGWDFVSDDSVPQDGNGHGTHVAGTIAATGSNATGVVGVAPGAKVLPLRALDNDGSGWMSDIAAAFAYAGDHSVPVVNASLGGDFSNTLQNVIASHPATLYVIAAGNSNANNDVPASADYPCALPAANILCVGATDSNDAKAGFSNYGATTVDLSAPGVGILSTWKDASNAYRFLQGTSMATPHVAGAAALALAASPGATTSQLKWALTSSVDVKAALAGTSVTGGRLNADAAVAAITGEGPDPTPTPEPIATPTPTPTPTASPVATPTAAPVVTPPVTTPAPVVPVVTPAPTATPTTYLFDVTVGGSLATKRSKLRVHFSLSRAASVRLSVARRGARRPVASWTKRAHSGANAITITRRLPSGRTLKPGRYTLAVGLNASATSSRAFRVR